MLNSKLLLFTVAIVALPNFAFAQRFGSRTSTLSASPHW